MADEDNTCPLCMEEMDLIDKNFVPCPCGYRVCMWCWHHIKENLNGLCPACRVPYKDDPHVFAAVDRNEVVKQQQKNKEKKQKERIERKAGDKGSKNPNIDRKHLHNYRVVQRNLVYIIGVPSSIANEDVLRKAEYFGQYGQIHKIVVHRNSNSSHPTVSAYITFTHKDDAKAAITALEGFYLDGHHLRASFGTTKYCNNFIRGVPCSNPECVYLHDLGEDDDRFTKEEIQAGHSKLNLTPGANQVLMTGNGGPSGTGKKCADPVLPPPMFVAEMEPPPRVRGTSTEEMRASTAAEEERKMIARSNIERMEAKDALPSSASNLATPVSISDKSNVDSVKSSAAVATAPSAAPTSAAAKNSDNSNSSSTHEPAKKDSAPSISASPLSTAVASPAVSDFKGSSGDEVTPTMEVPKPSPLAFNGIGACAVFPVPVSAFSVTIWSRILRCDRTDLLTNPYAGITVPMSDLFELTLPPVDAMVLSPWPRPPAYYTQAMPPKQQQAALPPVAPAAQNNNGAVPKIAMLQQLFPSVNISNSNAKK